MTEMWNLMKAIHRLRINAIVGLTSRSPPNTFFFQLLFVLSSTDFGWVCEKKIQNVSSRWWSFVCYRRSVQKTSCWTRPNIDFQSLHRKLVNNRQLTEGNPAVLVNDLSSQSKLIESDNSVLGNPFWKCSKAPLEDYNNLWQEASVMKCIFAASQ